jgi:hypothetical protein
MRFTSSLATVVAVAALFIAAQFRLLAGQDKQDKGDQNSTAAKENLPRGMPARVAATEYQAHGQAGSVSIGAEFAGHSVPTPDHAFSTEDYIVVEAGFFGPPGAHLMLSRDDFSLRIAGRKTPLASEPYEIVLKSLKDPEWQPPESEASKDKGSKGGITTGGGGGGSQDSAPPPPPKMPFPLRRAMEQQVERSAMDIGDRPLPQAGLLFFSYHGKPENIKSMELIYSGAAGKATMELEP